MATGAGSGLPRETMATEVGRSISVVVRLGKALLLGGQLLQPGRNSVTGPLTSTSSPTATAGALLVNTKMASDVASSASGAGSCMLKPLLRTKVTMPGRALTAVPATGERCARPCTSWMRSGPGPATTVKPKL